MRPRTLVLAFLLFLSLAAAAETPVAPLVFGRAPEYQSQPRIASREGSSKDGAWFVAWWDGREVVSGVAYGARLDADGALLDPLGIRLGGLGAPRAVGCGAGRCAIVDAQLRFAIVDGAGTLVAAGSIPDSFSAQVDVIYNGRDFIVFAGANGVRAWTLSVDGRVAAEPSVIVPFRQSGATHFHAAAFNGSRFLVLYVEDQLLKAAFASPSAAPLATDSVIATSPEPLKARVASLAGEFVAVWDDITHLRAQRFDAAGAQIGDVATVGGTVLSFDVTRDGDGYAVYAIEWPALTLTETHLARDLAAGQSRGVSVPQPSAVASLAAAAGPNGSVAAIEVSDRNQTRGSEIFAAGFIAPPVLVTRAAAAQRHPKIAVGSNTMLVVSEEDRGAGPDQPLSSIEATLTDRRTGLSKTFAVATSAIGQYQPAVAVAGDAYLVTWFENGLVLGRIVRGGEPGARVEIDRFARAGATVSSDGRDFFAACLDYPSGVSVVKISAEGSVAGRSETISTSSPVGAPAAAIACGRGECLLAWRDLTITGICGTHSVCQTDDRVLATRMSSSLVPRDTTPIVLMDIPYGIGDITAAAAPDGSYAVAFDLDNSGPLRIRLLDALGAPGPTLERTGYHPVLARQGDAWLLLYDTSRFADSQIRALRFRDAAAVDFAFLAPDVQTRTHAAAAADGERVAVVYERTTRGEAAGGVPRVFLTAVDAPGSKSRAVRR